MLFGLTQILGIAVAWRYLSFSGITIRPAVSLRFSLTDFVLIAAFLGVVVWASIKRNRSSRFFFRVFFLLILWGGIQIVLGSFFSPLPTLALSVLLIVGLLSARRIVAQNILVLLAIAGVGAVIGLSLTPTMAVIALLLFSFYDIFAVYISRHMIKMAEGMIASGAIFGFVIPAAWRDFYCPAREMKPGERFMILGSGDIALPLVLSASLTRTSLTQAAIVTAFSFLGLFITHLLFVNQKKRRAMAALPPIAVASIVGYLTALFLI